ncbi:CHRD domain-containing protein [Massilia sp. YIM B02763]|uniref:CHRD domain-containing protein n=1 Tax=Massilia sp. YIM B02763 TaxID=3050130 RepID=UPI0025B6C34D|nr:CHRD domain-containing protein [Massilia sp. YIM B02763]MDN4055552.1 CHRD domain-containing protein [Massilia sp. YIM B02763]
MKRVLPILALAAASSLAVPALAQSGGTTYQATAVGALEVPPNASPGTATVAVEIPGRQLLVDLSFRGLLGSTTGAHIHCCTDEAFTGTSPIALPFTGFPTGVSGGEYSAAFNLGDEATYDPAFLAAYGGTASGAAAALLAGINANEAYVNIHTDAYPNGEIRGFLVAAPIPEPAEWAMLGIGLGGLLWMNRRRRQPEPGLAA